MVSNTKTFLVIMNVLVQFRVRHIWLASVIIIVRLCSGFSSWELRDIADIMYK